jgi:hypothetical protein
VSTLVLIIGGADKGIAESEDLVNFDLNGFNELKIDSKETEPDEIVADLITGEKREIHSIKGSMHFTEPRLDKFERKINEYYVGRKTIGLRRMIYDHIESINGDRRRYTKGEIKSSTLLDNDDSKAVCLPSFNPEPQWCIFRNTIRIGEYGLGEKEAKELIEKNFFWRKHKLEHSIEREPEFLIAHFQYIDSHQHLFYEYPEQRNLDKVKNSYREMDEYLGKVLEKAGEHGFENILIMSEYGLPAKEEDSAGDTHSRNAFYSNNFSEKGVKDLKEMHNTLKGIIQ